MTKQILQHKFYILHSTKDTHMPDVGKSRIRNYSRFFHIWNVSSWQFSTQIYLWQIWGMLLASPVSGGCIEISGKHLWDRDWVVLKYHISKFLGQALIVGAVWLADIVFMSRALVGAGADQPCHKLQLSQNWLQPLVRNRMPLGTVWEREKSGKTLVFYQTSIGPPLQFGLFPKKKFPTFFE